MPSYLNSRAVPTYLKIDSFEELAQQCDALADARRLAIIFALLREGELSVEGLSDRVGQTPLELVRRLAWLRRAGLVEQSQDDQAILYSLATGTFHELINRLQELIDPSINAAPTFEK